MHFVVENGSPDGFQLEIMSQEDVANSIVY
jgi:hypothetical protein